MDRGMIFSADAVLALIVVITLAAWLPHQIDANQQSGDAYENLRDPARDEAINKFYDMTLNDASYENEQISNAAEFGRCYEVYTLDPNNSLGTRAVPEKHTFCEEIK